MKAALMADPVYCLLKAVKERDFEETKRLLDTGVDINCLGQGLAGGITPLIEAVFHGLPDMAAFLLSCGADPNFPNNYGYSPLMAAANGGQLEITERLLESGAKVNIQDSLNETPLWKAVKQGAHKVVRLLLEAGAVDTQHGGEFALEFSEKLLPELESPFDRAKCATNIELLRNAPRGVLPPFDPKQ